MPAEWTICPPWSQRDDFARRLGISPLVAQILHNRGVVDPEDARRFLKPDLNALYPPETLPGALEAADLIGRKIDDRRPIVIYGDYDVDGITAVAILWQLLTRAGADVSFYIPHRLEEGYGLNADALRQLRSEGADTVVTVDCGITALEEARLARQIGLTLVVTDHHMPLASLPEADAIVHPRIGAGSPNPEICGAGVAFKLAWAIARRLSRGEKVTPDLRQFLLDATALVALGTIADVVPLLGENRVLAGFGIKSLRNSTMPGLAALIASANLGEKRLNSDDVGFWLAPRLNAAGRMGHARLAAELLTRADAARAAEIARYLESQNRSRQTLQRRIFDEAREEIERRNLASDARRAVVLAREGWHPGVIGIVASRLVETYSRPTILIGINGGEGQGSGRSIRNLHMHQVLTDCAEHLLGFGGHAMAAGLRVAPGRIEAFAEAFVARANRLLTARDLEPSLRLDAEVPLDALTEPLVRDLERLGPFGTGNPRPRFASPSLTLASEPRLVGRNADHLQLHFTDGRQSRKAIAFGRKDLLEPLQEKRRCRVAFEPILNSFNGRTSVELQVVDVAF